ncbi:MAG: hypothetical protein FWC97_09490 [Treponema sp.]|nr:hypothetical protein [Treponema sp.]
MAHESLCKTGAMAVTILETIIKPMKEGTPKQALTAVMEWATEAARHEKTRTMTHEECEAKIIELLTNERNMMTADELRERANFYLAGIMPKEKFKAMTPQEQDEYFKNGGSTLQIG